MKAGESKPESPDQRAWRTWRAAYQAHYKRVYPPQSTDGPAMKRAAKLAVEMCTQLGRSGDGDLEVLLVHRWRAFLADPGQSRTPGGPGYLRETFHRLQDFERGVAAYGTPWDRAAQPDREREPQIVPPRRPAPRFANGALPPLESPGPDLSAPLAPPGAAARILGAR